jgi:DNA processing protein
MDVEPPVTPSIAVSNTDPSIDLASLDQLSLEQLRVDQLIHLLQFLPGFGPASFWRLERELEDIRQLFTRNIELLTHLLPPKPAAALAQLRHHHRSSPVWGQWLEALERCGQGGVQVITYKDDHYPQLLKEINAAPPVLYCRGALALLQRPQLAIVGSRRASRAGLNHARQFANAMAGSGFTITSGLALGIDAASHQGALEVGGTTLAVLGSGVDRVYPQRNQALAEAILNQGGALVSEFAPGTQPHPSHFPRRNRVISGLSLGILVVEAALKSGSLITARYGLEHNREVFAIPGSIHNPVSRGCHALIKEGAALVETGVDILEQLQGWLPKATPAATPAMIPVSTAVPCQGANLKPDLTDHEHKLWKLIGFESSGLDTLVAESNLSTGDTLAALMGLELKGLIEQSQGGYQRLC